MTDLSRLTVSLTKYGAHLVARVINSNDPTDVLKNTGDPLPDTGQARKNLSALPDDSLPPVWAKAKLLGTEAVEALVLVAIIFSHHTLISTMQGASDRSGFSGRIARDKDLDGKEFSNFARVMEQLGYADPSDQRGFRFNLTHLFDINGLGPAVAELLAIKLAFAGWTGQNSIASEAVRLNLHRVLGTTAKEFDDWLTADAPPSLPPLSDEDEEFFEGIDPDDSISSFEFKPGHTPRDVGPLPRSASARSKAERLHNDMQNRLFDYLVNQLGEDSVGTEQGTGSGTSIDIVTRQGRNFTFYEIKTARNIRACIRQAVPQLLEYAYWPDECRANELVIVGPHAISDEARKFIVLLQDRFSIPISYRQYDAAANVFYPFGEM